MRIFIPRFVGAALYFFLLTIVGMIGYMWIEGASAHNALYMAVITETAVGFSEIIPLSQTGRTFTIFILAGGVTGLGIWFALITSFIVEMDLKDRISRADP